MTKVLVFESDPAFGVELRTKLTELGCTVQVFSDGQRGLMVAAGAPQPPDLVLLSVELERSINGFSVCNKMKKHPQLMAVPLIILSSHSSPETFAQHQQLPTRAQDYVHKPIRFEELLPRIQALVPLAGPVIEEADSVMEIEEVEVLDDSDVAPDSDDGVATVDADPEMVAAVRATAALAATVPDESEILATHEASRPRAFSGYASPAQRAREARLTPPRQPVEALLPYALDGEEDEETMIASRAMLEQARAQLQAQRASSMPPSSQSHPAPNHSYPPAAVAPVRGSVPPASPSQAHAQAAGHAQAQAAAFASTGQHWPVPAHSAHAAEIAQLRQALARTKQQFEHASYELAQMRPVAAEAQALREQLDLSRQQVAALTNTATNFEREALELREALQQRDKNLLESREKLSSKERELLSARDQNLSVERTSAELKSQVIQLETERNELQAKLDAAAADKELADKRADDFKLGAKKIAEQLNLRSRELRDVRTAHDDAVKQLEARLEEDLRQNEVSQRRQLAELEGRHQNALTALRDEHATATQELREHYAEQAKEQEAGWAQSGGEREAALKNDIERLQGELADQRDSTELLQTEHQAALEAAETAHASEKAKLADAADAQVADLEGKQALALKQLQADGEEALQQLREEHARADEETAQRSGHREDALRLQLETARTQLTESQDLERSLQRREAELSAALSELQDRATATEAELEQQRSLAGKAQERWQHDRQSLDKAREALASVVEQLAGAPAEDD